MDDLQYLHRKELQFNILHGFKPCYIWMTFNTTSLKEKLELWVKKF